MHPNICPSNSEMRGHILEMFFSVEKNDCTSLFPIKLCFCVLIGAYEWLAYYKAQFAIPYVR